MAATGAGATVVSKENIETMTSTLSFLSTIHDFEKTEMGKHLGTGLKVLEYSDYAETILRDPKQGLTELGEGVIINAMNTVPFLYGLNVAGDISATIIPVLRATEKRLSEESGHGELLDEYRAAKGIFELFFAYHEGVHHLAKTTAESTLDLVLKSSEGFAYTAINIGRAEQHLPPIKADDPLMRKMPELGNQLGLALQQSKHLQPLHKELGIVPAEGYGKTSSISSPGSIRVEPPKPMDMSVGVKLIGGAGGIGAAIKITVGITLGSVLTFGFVAVGMAVASIFLDRSLRDKAKEFERRVNVIKKDINLMVKRVDDLCASSLSNVDKVIELKKIIVEIDNDYLKHRAKISGPLDDVYKKAEVARPAIDKLRGVFTSIRDEIRDRIIPALEGKSIVFGASVATGGSVSVLER